MAEVIKCPACGALWRVKDAAPEYRCGACGRIFAAETAESVVVPDKKLDEAMLEKAKRTVLPEDNVPDAPRRILAQPSTCRSARPFARSSSRSWC